MQVTQYDLWEDGNAVDVQVLHRLAEEVIDAKRLKSPVIHCLAGKGRTGTLTVATILTEDINSKGALLGLNRENYKQAICKLITDLRNNGGGIQFVHTVAQLELLFDYAHYLLNQ